MPIEISAAKLSFGLRGDDVTQLQRAMQALGRNVPLSETQVSIFGPGTTAALKALQTDLGLAATGVVDDSTVSAINQALAVRGKAQRTIRGRVTDADGNAPQGFHVELYLQQPGGEKAIGKATVNSKGGYHINYRVPEAFDRADLRIEVQKGDAAVDTMPPNSSILTDADVLEVVDFALIDAKNPPSSDFTRLIAELQPLLGGRDPGTLKEDAKGREISVLAVRSDRSVAEVAALSIASRLAAQTTLPTPLFYALLREGLPSDLSSLQATHPDVLAGAISAAVDKGLVPAMVNGVDLASLLPGLAPTLDAGLREVLGGVLKPREIDVFWTAYQKAGSDPAAFWNDVAADPDLGDRAEKLKLSVQLAGLTDANLPLTAAILRRPEIARASDLAKLTLADWTTLVSGQGVSVLSDFPGDTPEAQAAAYVNQIHRRVEAAFPSAVFAARLGPSPVASFLEANPTFDLKTTYPGQFFKQNPGAVGSLPPEGIAQLQSLQRLYRLTESAAETLALWPRNHLRSADLATFGPSLHRQD